MRTIKFRVWEVNKFGPSRMSQPVTIWDIHNNGLGTFGDTYEPMQYTGLKDKNGKEIYEGDILEIDGKIFDDKKTRLSSIIWNKNAYGWRLDLMSNKMIKERHLKIIGNIHENPGLL